MFLSIVDLLKSSCSFNICLPMPEGPGLFTVVFGYGWRRLLLKPCFLKNLVLLFLHHLYAGGKLSLYRQSQAA